jgi:hypothetical protein
MYNVLHVSDQKDNFQALYKYNSTKKKNWLYYNSYPSWAITIYIHTFTIIIIIFKFVFVWLNLL